MNKGLRCFFGFSSEGQNFVAKTAWGDETNGIRAGMNWEPFGRGNSKVSESVQIVLLTSKTNTGFNYVAPPDKKFTKLELRDAQGVLLYST